MMTVYFARECREWYLKSARNESRCISDDRTKIDFNGLVFLLLNRKKNVAVTCCRIAKRKLEI